MIKKTPESIESKKMSFPKIILDESIYIFIALILFRGIFVMFNGNFAIRAGYSTSGVTGIYYGIMYIMLCFSIPNIFKSIFSKRRYVIFYMFTLLLGYIQGYLSPYVNPYISRSFMDDIKLLTTNCLYSGLIFVMVGIAASDYKKLLKWLTVMAYVGIITAFLTDIIRVFVTTMKSDDDMNFAYYLCLFTCFLMIKYVREHKVLDLILMALGIFLVLFSGTRGPVVCLLVSFSLYFITNKNSNATKLIIMFLCVFVWILLYTGLLQNIIRSVSHSMGQLGFSTRIFDYASSNMLSDSSGRDELQSLCWRAIRKSPIMGKGLGYDRVILNESYCHNLIIEMFLSFGVPLGITFIGLIVISLLKGLKSVSGEYRFICAWLIGVVVVRLMFSSSFLLLPEFYIMIGILIAHEKEKETV